MTHVPLNFTRRIIAFMFLFNLCIACCAYADGVTIMTHGWNLSIGGAPVWLESLRDAVSKNYLGDEQNYGKITVTKSGNNLVATCDPWNFDLTVGSSGEILIILDWSEVADHLFGGPPAQDVAAIVIDKIVSSQNNKAPLAELPIHLIGHSRGGGMVCEIARLLGEKGIVVDHLTPLTHTRLPAMTYSRSLAASLTRQQQFTKMLCLQILISRTLNIPKVNLFQVPITVPGEP